MLELPDRLELQLTDLTGRELALAGVLLTLRFSVGSRYYYGDLLGVTGNRGRLVTSAKDLRTRFEENRRLFPMDCRIDLEMCDSLVEVVILSPEEVRQRRLRIPENAMISTSSRRLYDSAVNDQVVPTSIRLDFARGASPVLHARLPTEVAKATRT